MSMPLKAIENHKLYYTISEVAESLHVNASLLRFWEKEFEEIEPRKNKKGNRIYTDADLKILRMVYYLVKERGFTLEGAKKKIKESRKEIEDKTELIDSLKQVRTMLLELKESI